MFPPFVLDKPIQDLRYVDEFMEKAAYSFRNSQSYSKRFVWQHCVFKFCQRGNGEWLLYKETDERGRVLLGDWDGEVEA